MSDDQFARAVQFEIDAKSTAPASKGMVLREIRAAVDAITEALKAQFAKVASRQESTDQLMADLDRRLAELERMK